MIKIRTGFLRGGEQNLRVRSIGPDPTFGNRAQNPWPWAWFAGILLMLAESSDGTTRFAQAVLAITLDLAPPLGHVAWPI